MGGTSPFTYTLQGGTKMERACSLIWGRNLRRNGTRKMDVVCDDWSGWSLVIKR
ncbi:MAG: hypothetical protein IPQ04_04555 [Saprospiraceae bacterium]|nr:hypothetical protein [Saprospiraceae bacterium]